MPYQESTIELFNITCHNSAVYLCDVDLMKIVCKVILWCSSWSGWVAHFVVNG